MAGGFEGLSGLEWHLFADIFPPAPPVRGRGMPHTPFRQVVNTLLYVRGSRSKRTKRDAKPTVGVAHRITVEM
jgi:hypothetical protein